MSKHRSGGKLRQEWEAQALMRYTLSAPLVLVGLNVIRDSLSLWLIAHGIG